MTLYSYPITIEKEGKQYYAYSDDFPGVYGIGKTMEAAKRGTLEAMRIYLDQSRHSLKSMSAKRTTYA
jgi:predicted RNase H-like HicB family nuclease